MTPDLISRLRERADFWNRHGSHDPEYSGYFSANDAMLIYEAASALEAQASRIAEMEEALHQALIYVEADETQHGRQFGTGNAIRSALSPEQKK